jgi:hypothetical protein
MSKVNIEVKLTVDRQYMGLIHLKMGCKCPGWLTKRHHTNKPRSTEVKSTVNPR